MANSEIHVVPIDINLHFFPYIIPIIIMHSINCAVLNNKILMQLLLSFPICRCLNVLVLIISGSCYVINNHYRCAYIISSTLVNPKVFTNSYPCFSGPFSSVFTDFLNTFWILNFPPYNESHCVFVTMDERAFGQSYVKWGFCCITALSQET